MKFSSHQKQLLRILAGAVVYAVAVLYPAEQTYAALALYLLAFLIIGGDIVYKAVRRILRGQVFDENFLMSLATVGAFAIGYYSEGVAVMLFYQVGELFQSYAVGKSRKSIAALMDIRPDYANVQRGDAIKKVEPFDVSVGDSIVVKPGERVPLDAVVTAGSSALDTSALTGESLPREVGPGDVLLSGCINISGALTARVTKPYGESTVSRILDLVENASGKKSQSEQFITKFARYYTPGVVIVAALLAALPPLLLPGARFSDWLYRALIFLVVSCPCALVISIPLSFFGGIGGESRNGILVKGGNYLETLARTEIIAFDKTGTLTRGVFRVQQVMPDGIDKDELIELAAHAESLSNHPISLSLRQAYGKPVDGARVSAAEELPGKGVVASVDGRQVAAGNAALMREVGVAAGAAEGAIGTAVHVAIDREYRGYIVIADELKPDAEKAIAELRASGIRKLIMLTGDAKEIGEQIGKQLGLDAVYAALLPADKVEKVESLLAEKSASGKLAFVGDGINDAPVLARADIGIAMGGLGSDAAIEAADVVIMTDEPSRLPVAIRLAKKTLRIAKQNIAIALSVKGAVLLLGALGVASMWAAVFADVGVAVIAILNAIRMLRVAK